MRSRVARYSRPRLRVRCRRTSRLCPLARGRGRPCRALNPQTRPWGDWGWAFCPPGRTQRPLDLPARGDRALGALGWGSPRAGRGWGPSAAPPLSSSPPWAEKRRPGKRVRLRGAVSDLASDPAGWATCQVGNPATFSLSAHFTAFHITAFKSPISPRPGGDIALVGKCFSGPCAEVLLIFK